MTDLHCDFAFVSAGAESVYPYEIWVFTKQLLFTRLRKNG